ncbi:glycosyl transferase family 1 [Halalkaliarchaeum desulfuricum]|uniref:Glycosyl transferase family 1 n=1 Tax=Halalkaliarchaeum desulfuricum TaxID=2055893 RepID=A0A343TN98_9EURY|nr:glycosyltransferase family 4 protein [Halalkaliarchaeum desulfuricum]AUX10570.1 glycosyl transferase family 1 [Halalkaliarchaeum desulfuricum]
MIRALIFLNSITHTSIPFELSVRIAEITEGEIVIASFYDDDFDDQSPVEDIADLPVDVRTFGATSRFDQKAWSAFHNELNQGYDLIHTHHNFSGSVARLLATKEDHPIVNTEHRNHRSNSPLQNIVNAPTLPLADRIVSNSQITQDSFRWYERLLLKDSQLDVIHNGVDIERIDNVITETPNLNEESSLRICTVGRMVPVKNQSTLLRAFDSVVEEHQQAELLFVGDGPLRSELETLAVDLGINDNVQFTGEVPRHRVYEIFAQSDVFAMPSIAEGFCVAVVEAMAAGLPVVVSDIPIFHEVVDDVGIFAQANDPSQFTTAISKLLSKPVERDRLGKLGSRRVREQFSLEETAKQYIEVYEQCVADL